MLLKRLFTRAVAGEVGLLELLRGEQEDTAPEENAMAARWFGDHDKDQDMTLSKEEALELLKEMGKVDIDNLPADWFSYIDTNDNELIDPEEFDEDSAKTME
ncbi:Hypp4386 [Branchiostoma lanceolatum]|uniref:Hypp4386 protein n=1 Tax=Branchiostoma lanceolatum TaxID=7740 RepID=A0A8K0A7Y6_BRALA|nr:Hypp4386 [Branchiostoma lanceolatum]